MRIIGDAGPDKIAICRNCGKIIGFLPIDVRERGYVDIGGADIERTIKCPNCSKEINV